MKLFHIALSENKAKDFEWVPWLLKLKILITCWNLLEDWCNRRYLFIRRFFILFIRRYILVIKCNDWRTASVNSLCEIATGKEVFKEVEKIAIQYNKRGNLPRNGSLMGKNTCDPKKANLSKFTKLVYFVENSWI